MRLKVYLLHKSGLEFTAAYWSEPIKPRKDCRSASVTGSSGCTLRVLGIEIGDMSLMYCVWLMRMELSGCCSILSPVKVKFLFLCDPNGNMSARACNRF